MACDCGAGHLACGLQQRPRGSRNVRLCLAGADFGSAASSRVRSGWLGEHGLDDFVGDAKPERQHVVQDVATGQLARVTDITYDAEQVFPLTLTQSTTEHVLTTTVRMDERFGSIRKVIDPNGVAVRYAYDSLGLRTKTVGPTGTTTYAYAPEALARTTTPAGVIFPASKVTVTTLGLEGSFGGTAVEERDAYGRVVRTRTTGFGGDQVISERAYDARGHVSATSAPHVATAAQIPISRYTYDFLDRPVQTDHGVWSGGTTTYQPASAYRLYASAVSLGGAYEQWLTGLECGFNTFPTDCATDVEVSIDEEGKSNVLLKDHAGRVVRSIDGENLAAATHTSNYQYGAFGRLRRIIDNGGASTGFVYDDYGRLLAHFDPDADPDVYLYTGFDEVSASQDGNGQVRQFYYDTLGRLQTIHDSAGYTTWTYDEGLNALGQLTHSSSPPTAENPLGQQVDYEYEAATPQHHRALPETVSHLIDGINYNIGFHYDDLGRPDTIDYPTVEAGAPIRAKYRYDDLSGGLLRVSEIGSGTQRLIWQIDQAFQGYLPEQETFGNGATTTLGYDPDRHWLTSIHTTVGVSTVQDLSYSHYDNGQILDRVSPDKSEEFAYDPVGRLKSVLTNGSGAATEYHYDEFGNITRRGNTTSTYQYQDGYPHLIDQVGGNTYYYDFNGNVSDRVGPDVPRGRQTFSYTPFNLPKLITTGTGTSARATQIDYSAAGDRVVRRDIEGFLGVGQGLSPGSVAADQARGPQHSIGVERAKAVGQVLGGILGAIGGGIGAGGSAVVGVVGSETVAVPVVAAGAATASIAYAGASLGNVTQALDSVFNAKGEGGSPKDAQKAVQRDQGPRDIRNIHRPEQDVPGSQWHAHQAQKVDGKYPALNLDGSPHDGVPNFSQKTLEWLKSFGWNIGGTQ